jgi:hypothetical protein
VPKGKTKVEPLRISNEPFSNVPVGFGKVEDN